MTVSRFEVQAAARQWLGTPFAHQHRALGIGCDCAGLVIGVAKQLGLIDLDFDVNAYSPVPDGSELREQCDRHLIPTDVLRIGDVVLVAWRSGVPQHLGIVVQHHLGALAMIHADSRRQRRVIETRLVFGRAMRFVAAYSLPGVD